MKTHKKHIMKKPRTLKKWGGAAASGAERFKCPFCDKTYSAISNIYPHCQTKHRDRPMVMLTYDNTVIREGESAPAAAAAPAPRADDEIERFKCPYCDKTYSAMTNIYGHCERRHRQPRPRLTYANTVVRVRIADLLAANSPGPIPVQMRLAAAAAMSPAVAAASASRAVAASASRAQQLAAVRPIPVAAVAASALAAAAAPGRVGPIVSRSGTLLSNPYYITNPVMIPNFPTSDGKLQRSSKYMDWIEMDEKNVLDVLNEDPNTLAFKIGGSFCVITKDELFTLMNNPDSIKYECDKICDYASDGLKGISDSVMKAVPYLSIGSFSQFQGLVSFSDLWHIIVSQQPQPQAYELVEVHRPRMLSTASHNFLFGSGLAGARAVSAAHCQAGQDATLYEIRILPINTTPSRDSRAATTIQRVTRGHRSRRATNRSPSNSSHRSRRGGGGF